MAPFKCPDCGTWWAGPEHRCPPNVFRDGVTWPPADPSGTFTVRCNCPPERFTTPNLNYNGNCPIHDIQTTYTPTVPRA